jgi:DNA-binding MarR family transcriptional regulator
MKTDTTAAADIIERLALWIRRQSPNQVSSSTVTTLDTLESIGPLRVSDLAEREAISQPGMTMLVNRLEAAGQAERIPDPTDGRAALVRITALGRSVLADRHESRIAVLQAHLARLDEDDRQTLAAALPAIRRLISAPPVRPPLREKRS